MGHDKEPPQPHGPKQGGGHPLVHSHSFKPKRAVKGAGRKKAALK